jgi:hypothetical protein
MPYFGMEFARKLAPRWFLISLMPARGFFKSIMEKKVICTKNRMFKVALNAGIKEEHTYEESSNG